MLTGASKITLHQVLFTIGSVGDASGLEKIYIACGYTDIMKSIDGHCAIVEEQQKLGPGANVLFLFYERHCDRIKPLYHEPDEIVLIYKWLSMAGGYQ